MKKNKSLLVSWCVFGVVIISFFTLTKFYYISEKSDEFCYHYLFKIDENILKAAKEKNEKIATADGASKAASPKAEMATFASSQKSDIKIGEQGQQQSESIKSAPDTTDDSVQRSGDQISSLSSSRAQTIARDSELYEKLPCGYVPKISPDGLRVCDVYAASENPTRKLSITSKEKSAKENRNELNQSQLNEKQTDPKAVVSPKFQEDSSPVHAQQQQSQQKICLVVLLDAATDPSYLSNIMHRLKIFGNSKVTFIVPHYSNYLLQNVRTIIAGGHEFFLQIPTQTSVPARRQASVAPFLANMNSTELISKLHTLLASTKCAIGVANIAPTLLTKSFGVMSGIVDELVKRGLIFLDLEPSNEVMRKISETNPDFMYMNTSKKFKKGMDIREIVAIDRTNIHQQGSGGSSDGSTPLNEDDKSKYVANAPSWGKEPGRNGCIVVSIDDLPEFLDGLSQNGGKDIRFAPVSSRIKK